MICILRYLNYVSNFFFYNFTICFYNLSLFCIFHTVSKYIFNNLDLYYQIYIFCVKGIKDDTLDHET
jgi:hypothetical protein